uniref:Cornichon n=1 Tax=Strigamia maritima TaxID=126957 RepID=T1IWW1_STRMM
MAFTFAAFSYIAALILDAFLIFFAIFHIIAFDELKTDYKNPIDQCNSLNPVTRLTRIFHPHIFQSPIHHRGRMVYINSKRSTDCVSHTEAYLMYKNRPVMSSPGLYDPTTIMNADQLSKAQTEGWFKLAFYLLGFFYYLY